jgi:hypothetical protein
MALFVFAIAIEGGDTPAAGLLASPMGIMRDARFANAAPPPRRV